MQGNDTLCSNANPNNATLSVGDAKSLRKELQEIRNRINFLLDSLDAGNMNDRYGVSAMADALQEKTAGLGGVSSNSIDPSDSASRSGTGLDALPNSNGALQPNNISSESGKEFDPFNTAQKPSSTFQHPQIKQEDQVSVASHNSSTAANVRPEIEVSASGGGFQRPDVASVPTNTVAPQQQQQPVTFHGAYNPAGYPMGQQPSAQQQVATTPSISGPPSSNVQPGQQPGAGQPTSAPITGYSAYPQQQPVYQTQGAIQTPTPTPATGPTQAPTNQSMYPQQYPQQGYNPAAQPSQGAPPRGPPIGPPQTMMAPGANPYGMSPRGQGPATPNGTFSRYPQAPAYR